MTLINIKFSLLAIILLATTISTSSNTYEKIRQKESLKIDINYGQIIEEVDKERKMYIDSIGRTIRALKKENVRLKNKLNNIEKNS